VKLALQTPLPTATPTADPRTIQTWLTNEWPTLLQAALLIVLAIVALRLVLNWTSSAMRRARIDTGTQILVRRGLSVVVVLITAVIVLSMLGADPAGLVTLVAAVGLAFSLAMQDILKNFFAGVYLLLERPFRVGEVIKVKDQQGTVENIGVRTTMLRTPDNVHVLVPNAIVFAEVVANHTYVTPVEPATDGKTEPPKAEAATPTPERATPSPPKAG
jgi:small conductance mechanosensitive channel